MHPALTMNTVRRTSAWIALGLSFACSTAPGPSGSGGSDAPPPDAVLVRISYGSEKKAFLTDSADAFHRTTPRTRAGQPIHVELIAEGSAESMESILAGRKDLVVWSPASSLLVDVLNDRWAEKGAATGTGAVRKVVAEAPSLVLSPLVIPMWEPMARALGWPDYLSAAVLYENLVVESALAPRYRDKPFPVVAVYPREGTFWSDHPYAILDLPSVTAEQREGAEAFRSFLLAPERQRAAMTRFGFRPVDPSIALGAPLDAAHGIDPAQPKNVLPNPTVAVTRRVLEGFESVKRPVSITFVIDTSGSMAGAPLKQAKAGRRRVLGDPPDADAARVMLFSNAPHWVSDRPEKLAASRPRLIQAIESSFANGGTALYDSLLQTSDPARGAGKRPARAVGVLRSGADTDI